MKKCCAWCFKKKTLVINAKMFSCHSRRLSYTSCSEKVEIVTTRCTTTHFLVMDVGVKRVKSWTACKYTLLGHMAYELLFGMMVDPIYKWMWNIIKILTIISLKIVILCFNFHDLPLTCKRSLHEAYEMNAWWECCPIHSHVSSQSAAKFDTGRPAFKVVEVIHIGPHRSK